MSSILHQLDSNEAMLLLYLAGELSEADRLEVQRRLAGSEDLRRQLEALQAAQAAIAAGLQELDRTSPLPVAASVAQRQVSRAIRQWQVDRLAKTQQTAKAPSQLRYPWWAYPLASAAAILLAFLAWWGNSPNLNSRTTQPPLWVQRDGLPGASSAPLDSADAELVAQQLQGSFEESAAPGQNPTHTARLEQAEQEMLALSRTGADWRMFPAGD